VFEGDIVRDDEGKKFEVLYRVGAFMIERQLHPDFGDDDKGWQFATLQDCSDGDETLREHEVIENSAPLDDTKPNTNAPARAATTTTARMRTRLKAIDLYDRRSFSVARIRTSARGRTNCHRQGEARSQ
jgi:hypothetical protein